MALALGAPGMAIADNASIPAQRNWNIPTGALGPALNQLAGQSGLRLNYPPELVAGKTSPGVSGELGVEQALRALLAGSGLDAHFSDDGAVTLVRARAPRQAKQGDPIELDPIVAIGRMPASTVVFGREVDTPDNRRVQDVLKGMPNILHNSETALVPSVRGIDGSGEMTRNQSWWSGPQPRVNTLVDGVARPFKSSSISSLAGVWDVEAVEVARGPQTTTTGRGSLAGAVRVSTRDPVHEFEAAARAGWFTEHKNVEGAAMVNLPLIADQVALRLAFEGSKGDSYVHTIGSPYGDDIDELKYENYRGKLLLTPDALPDTELVLSIEETKARQAQEPFADDVHADDLVYTGKHGVYDNEQTVYSARLSQGLGEKMDLEVRVSYLDNLWLLPPNETSPNYRDYETKTTSAEALLHFEELGLIDKGVAGVAYEHQEDRLFVPPPALNWHDGRRENYAIFGEVEVGIDGGWTAIAGGRHEWHRQSRSRSDRSTAWPGSLWPFWDASGDISDNAFLPKLGIRYDGADKYVAGYTYSEGWRPAGVDFTNKKHRTIGYYDDERLKNHEIWVRGNPTGRLRLDGSVFYYEFEDMQQRGTTSEGPCLGEPDPTMPWMSPCLTGNIPEAKGYGMELDARWDIDDPWRNTWTISGGLGLLDTEITDAGSVVPHYQGQELSQSPDVTANLGLGWVSPRGFDAQISARYVGRSLETYHALFDFLSSTSGYTDSRTVIDLKAGYETKFRGTDLRIDAWVENLTDKRYAASVMALTSTSAEVPGRPRTIGVALTARF
uniref:Outer membrane receptor proteins, mostly Fe transport n=1 Tax=Candidatus Kentrum sp. FW TaxID=2126338 RepID=A0A450TWY7_9GAMM|nr:MAG: Outer membrane receptor proteins, mostly Fe transport [Candidatus Kentron sp. FW]